MDKELLINNFVQRIYYQKGYLYWPPGPMAGQVFDKDKCEKDIREFLDKIVEEMVK